MEIPGLGEVTKRPEFDWYESQPLAVPVLGGKRCRIVVSGYDKDPNREEFHIAIANFLRIPPDVLKEVEPFVFRYYEICSDFMDPDERESLAILSPSEVWRHVDLECSPIVKRRAYGDKGIYVSLDCGCDWEEEHGLTIVFKNGLRVNKVGPYDGHVTNSDAYGNDDLEDVIFREW